MNNIFCIKWSNFFRKCTVGEWNTRMWLDLTSFVGRWILEDFGDFVGVILEMVTDISARSKFLQEFLQSETFTFSVLSLGWTAIEKNWSYWETDFHVSEPHNYLEINFFPSALPLIDGPHQSSLVVRIRKINSIRKSYANHHMSPILP